MSSSSALQPHLAILQIPAEYARPSNLDDPPTLAVLDEWRRRTGRVLREIKDIIENDEREKGDEVEEQSDLVFHLVPFTSENTWTTPESSSLAQDLLPSPTIPLIAHVLKNRIKPVFSTSRHPYLSRAARALPRPAGGAGAAQDYYEGQRWKEHPGVGTVLEWCVRSIPTEKYEELWPLVIPPTMTLLDDYEVQFKLQGVHTVSSMLTNVPPELLKRTGLDGLLLKSLSATIPLHDAPLLQASLLTILELIKTTTTPGTQAHFDQLSNLIGESIVNDTWFYASDKPDILLASISALPSIIDTLRVGTVRFLNALIPQLTHLLRSTSNVSLQIASLRALNTLIPHCAPRMEEWKAEIIDAAARCWVVEFIDRAKRTPDRGVYVHPSPATLKSLLQETMECLAHVCPSVLVTEFPNLEALDRGAFGDLLGRVPAHRTC